MNHAQLDALGYGYEDCFNAMDGDLDASLDVQDLLDTEDDVLFGMDADDDAYES